MKKKEKDPPKASEEKKRETKISKFYKKGTESAIRINV